MKPLGDGFIKMIKMIIAPIIFCTVVHGIASMQDMKKVGRVGLKALIYFEVLTTLALIVGLIVANTLQPGVGMKVDASTIDTSAIQGFVAKSAEQSTVQFLMDIIPNTVIGAFAQGEILQVLFFAILFAFGLHTLGERGKALLGVIDQASHALFAVVGIIMRVAPIGAFGAMAFTIGKYGVGDASLARSPHGRILLNLPYLHLRRFGRSGLARGFQHFQVHPLHQGRAADRAGNILVQVGATTHDRQNGKPWLREVRRWPCHPDGLLLQSRWHLHLSNDGRAVPGAGDQHGPEFCPAARDYRHPTVDLEGRRWRDRIGLHRACGNAFFGRHYSGG